MAADKYTVYRGKVYPQEVLESFASRSVTVSLRDGTKGYVDIVKRKYVVVKGKRYYKYFLEGTRIKYPFTPFKKEVDKDSAVAIAEVLGVKIVSVPKTPHPASSSRGKPQSEQYFKWRLPF